MSAGKNGDGTEKEKEEVDEEHERGIGGGGGGGRMDRMMLFSKTNKHTKKEMSASLGVWEWNQSHFSPGHDHDYLCK